MVKRMLVDATHLEETRVVVLDGTRLEEFDVETSTKKQIKGNIYLAKVIRVEPSLQAAFVDYGGNRHGFLAFSEIHPDYYQIPVADRERLLAEVHRHNDEDEPHGGSADDHHDHHEDDNQPDDVNDAHSTESHDAEESSAEDAGSALPLDFSTPAITGDVIENASSESEGDAEADEPKSSADGTEPEQAVATDVDPTASPLEPTDEPSPSVDSEVSAASLETAADQATTKGEAVPDESEESAAVPGQTSKTAGVETVGGDDEDETAGEDRQRRRFLASRHYKIQEVIKRRQIMLVQVVKEERSNKGAALTSFLSLAGRYCVLMPNSARGGGVSRKITSAQDRRRLKAIVGDLELPKSMAVILRTAGAERNKAEIKRDYEYLQRTWNSIREVTMTSRAPALIHEEASLIKRAIRDVYTRDIEEVWVDGEEGYKTAKDFMKMLTPSHAKKVQKYKDETIPLFHRYQVETQLESINNPSIQLKSGGSIVFAQTEALVAIDVNSGKSTKERHIEETAYRTNLEAAEEIARQLRLRDLAGLVVIDFIDMEENRNNHAVERKLKEALRADRARIQVGRISHFGLLELSRQRLRPSLIEANFRVCTHCSGAGLVRSTESAAVHSLRVLEEEGVRHRSSEVTITVHSDVALYLLNYKREALASIENRYGIKILVLGDNSLVPPDMRLDRVKAIRGPGEEVTEQRLIQPPAEPEPPAEAEAPETQSSDDTERHRAARDDEEDNSGRKRRRRRRKRRDPRDADKEAAAGEPKVATEAGSEDSSAQPSEGERNTEEQKSARPRDEQGQRPRRRGRRGGRRRRSTTKEGNETTNADGQPSTAPSADSASPSSQDAPQHTVASAPENAPAATTSSTTESTSTSSSVKNETESASRGPARLFRTLWKRGESAETETKSSAPPTVTADQTPAPAPQSSEPASTTSPRRGWWQGSDES